MSTLLKMANNTLGNNIWETIGLCRLDRPILRVQSDLRVREQRSDLLLSKMAKVWRIDLGGCIRLADRDEAAYFACIED